MDLTARIIDNFQSSIATKEQALQTLVPGIARAAETITAALLEGQKILICGNGGSAADAQHFAAEMVGRFQRERAALPAIALTCDTSILTAVPNDYGFEEVFARQVRGLGQTGDILVGISTSGQSLNVIRAMEAAQERGMQVIALTGNDGGHMATLAREEDVEIRVPSDSTARVQEVHILVVHCLCDLVDSQLLGG
jgi:D-sedoheptulose 7-phosphate isomerase